MFSNDYAVMEHYINLVCLITTIYWQNWVNIYYIKSLLQPDLLNMLQHYVLNMSQHYLLNMSQQYILNMSQHYVQNMLQHYVLNMSQHYVLNIRPGKIYFLHLNQELVKKFPQRFKRKIKPPPLPKMSFSSKKGPL